MREQPKHQTSPKQPEAAKLDPTAASAALAMAVTSAEKSSGKDGHTAPAKAASRLHTAWALALAGMRRHAAWAAVITRAGAGSHGAQAAALAVAIGLGWAAGSQALSGSRGASQGLPGWDEAATATIRQNQDDIVRLTGDVRTLKSTINSFRESFEQARIDTAGHSRPLLERLEALERAGQDTAANIVRVAETSERIERAGTAAETKLAAIGSKLDAIERQAAANPAQAAGADPAQTGSVPDAKSAAKQAPVEGWVLREVYDGGAVVESRNGRLHEVAPGRNLPSVGRVEAIERRGKIWVVVTAKGIIGPPALWR